MLSATENQVAVTGVTPPQVREATIRVNWPSVARYPAVGNLGRSLVRSIALAPLGWAVMLPFYFMKILPGIGRRYTLTNRRLVIQKGWGRKPDGEVLLEKIDDVRLAAGSWNDFFRSGTLEIIADGKVVLSLPGVKEPDVFRQAIRNACMAWVPDRARKWLPFIPAKAPDSK